MDDGMCSLILLIESRLHNTSTIVSMDRYAPAIAVAFSDDNHAHDMAVYTLTVSASSVGVGLKLLFVAQMSTLRISDVFMPQHGKHPPDLEELLTIKPHVVSMIELLLLLLLLVISSYVIVDNGRGCFLSLTVR